MDAEGREIPLDTKCLYIERAYTVGRMESSKAVARETARIIAEGIAKELGMTPGEEQTCDSR